MKKKIVTIGGGTGQYTLLRGLKNYDVEIMALVSMIDDGGHTGQLRDEFGVLPAGDLRRCLIALSDESNILRELLEYRFGDDCVGNRIIAALQNIAGKEKYVQEISRILRIKGKVLPITLNETTLYAETNKGKILEGQTQVSYSAQQDEEIARIWLSPRAFIFNQAAESLREADLIVISPGDLYGSILSSLIVEGFKEAIKETKAKIIYVCNLVTKQGTNNFKVSDFVKEIELYLGRKLDYIVCNTKKPSSEIVDKYIGENSSFVEIDMEDKRIIKSDLLSEQKSDGKTIARHDIEKVSRIIMELI